MSIHVISVEVPIDVGADVKLIQAVRVLQKNINIDYDQVYNLISSLENQYGVIDVSGSDDGILQTHNFEALDLQSLPLQDLTDYLNKIADSLEQLFLTF